MARPFKICRTAACLDASRTPATARTQSSGSRRNRGAVETACRLPGGNKKAGASAFTRFDLEIASEILASLKMPGSSARNATSTTTARWDRYGEVMAGILKRRTVSRADLDNIGVSARYERNEPTPEEQEVEEMKQAARVIKRNLRPQDGGRRLFVLPVLRYAARNLTWEV